MNIKKLATVFGVVFVAVGVLGFVPGITANGNLLGIFEVDLAHNLVHIVTGIIALAAMTSDKYAKLFFQVFGVVYALVTVVGFVQGSTILGLFGINLADNILHLVIALAALYLGFGVKSAGVPMKVGV